MSTRPGKASLPIVAAYRLNHAIEIIHPGGRLSAPQPGRHLFDVAKSQGVYS